jgi:ligand-binding SRPBCC domain-containing protein
MRRVYYELTDHFEVAADLDRAWQFFSTPGNLPLITPRWLGFAMAMKTPVTIELDAMLDYTIRWMKIPIKWRTRIIDWSPPRQFIDLQVSGPYRLWHHQHRFEPSSRGGTVCFDRVVYALPVPLLRRLVHPLIVRRQLREVFRFRRRAIGQRLGWVRPVQDDVEIRPLE